jgi:SAM-dependent methyltransferase
MNVELKQRGRASIDFVVSTARFSSTLEPQIHAAIVDKGLNEDSLVDDLDARSVQIETALADCAPFRLKETLQEWLSIHHGLVAREAFGEIQTDLAPHFEALIDGPTTIETVPGFSYPDYMDGVWIHRTHGGWEGHPDQGFIHAEMVHKRYLTTVYGGGIFGQRRAVLDHLPRQDYRRVFEMGVSSGFHTLALAQQFPEAQISGCDFSRPMLEQAQRQANENGLDWKLYLARAEDTGLPAASFDLVSSFIILHELPAKIIGEVFAEAFRLLEPGGAMIMTDVPPYAAQDKLAVWRADRSAKFGGEPYWREAGLVDTVAVAKSVGFSEARGFKLPGPGNYWVTLAVKA